MEFGPYDRALPGFYRINKTPAGRQVFETATSSPSDTCYFAGSSFLPAQLTLSGWYLGYYYFDSSYDYDYVGPTAAWVAYDRANGRIPCLVTMPQTINLYTHAGSTPYYNDTVYINLPDYVNPGVSRGGVQAWRTWP